MVRLIIAILIIFTLIYFGYKWLMGAEVADLEHLLSNKLKVFSLCAASTLSILTLLVIIF